MKRKGRFGAAGYRVKGLGKGGEIGHSRFAAESAPPPPILSRIYFSGAKTGTYVYTRKIYTCMTLPYIPAAAAGLPIQRKRGKRKKKRERRTIVLSEKAAAAEAERAQK